MSGGDLINEVFKELFEEVKNKNGTVTRNCMCDTWLAHWEKYSEIKAYDCANVNCDKLAEDGAHVIKCNGDDKQEYIVPLCHECNMQQDESFFVGKDRLVKAVNRDCEY